MVTTTTMPRLYRCFVDELSYNAISPNVRDPLEAGPARDGTITSELPSLPEILKAAATAGPHFRFFQAGVL